MLSMPCYPTFQDLNNKERMKDVKPMKEKGNFTSKEAYFNCLFRLLREDACN